MEYLSTPPDNTFPYLEPVSESAQSPPGFVFNSANPEQQAYDNLPEAAATRVVGGMSAHWTCCTPEQHPVVERSKIFSDAEWTRLYKEAKKIFRTSTTSYDDSIRHQLVKHVLQEATGKTREFTGMPLAGRRSQRNKTYVEWTSTAQILGDLANPDYQGDLFELKPQHQCTQLALDPVTGQIKGALLKDLLQNEHVFVTAKKYVICAGAVLTPGILVNSDLDGYPALVCLPDITTGDRC